MSLTKASYSMISGAKRNVFDFMTDAQRQSVTAGDLVEDVTAAIQAAFNSMTPYGTLNNPFVFQEFPVLVFPAGKYKITAELNLTYRNYVTLQGDDSWLYWEGADGGRMIDAQGNSYMNVLSLKVSGDNKLSTFIRICGAEVTPGPAPGATNNAHGLLMRDCFFYSFKYNDDDTAIIDTLNDTGTVGDYSLDDSRVEACWFFTWAYAAVVQGSGEWNYDNCHFASPVHGIIFNSGTTARFFQCIFGAIKYPIYVPVGQQCDSVELIGCYSENLWDEAATAPQPLGSLVKCVSGGNTSLKTLNIAGGLYQQGSPTGSISASDKFIDFGDAAGSLYLENVRFQGSLTPGFIDLGDNARAIVLKSTISSNYLDNMPFIRGKVSYANRFNRNGTLALSYTADPGVVQYIVVNPSASRDFIDGDPTTGLMTVTSLNRALQLADQVGMTNTTIAIDGPVSLIDPIALSGRVTIESTGTASIDFLNTIAVQPGGYLRLLAVGPNTMSISVSASATTINQALDNVGGMVVLKNITVNLARTVAYAVRHQDGDTSIADVSVTQGGLVDASTTNSTGDVTVFGGTYNNTYNVVYLNGSGCRVVLRSNSAPSNGIWSQGSQQINLTPASGNFIGRVCTTTGAPGTWSTFGAIS